MSAVPLARRDHDGPRHASWLELFYDLLFVALFAQLAHELVEDIRPAIVLAAFGLFAPAWWAWVSYTVSTNLFGEVGPAHRLLILTNMAGLLVMAAGVPAAFHGDPELYAAGFAGSRVVLLLLAAAWHLRQPGATAPVGSYVCYSASAVLWGASILTGAPVAYGLWTVSLVIEIAVRLREQAAPAEGGGVPPLDVELLVERFGLIVIVALGEGVVGIAGAIAETDGSSRALVTGIAGFVVLAGLWSWYFDFAASVVQPRLRDHTVGYARDVYLIGHFVLVGAIVSLSAGLGPIIAAAESGAAFETELTLVVDSLALVVVTIVAMSLRLGTGGRGSAVILLPTVPTLVVASLLGDDVPPAFPLWCLAVGIATVAVLARVRARHESEPRPWPISPHVGGRRAGGGTRGL